MDGEGEGEGSESGVRGGVMYDVSPGGKGPPLSCDVLAKSAMRCGLRRRRRTADFLMTSVDRHPVFPLALWI